MVDIPAKKMSARFNTIKQPLKNKDGETIVVVEVPILEEKISIIVWQNRYFILQNEGGYNEGIALSIDGPTQEIETL